MNDTADSLELLLHVVQNREAAGPSSELTAETSRVIMNKVLLSRGHLNLFAFLLWLEGLRLDGSVQSRRQDLADDE